MIIKRNEYQRLIFWGAFYFAIAFIFSFISLKFINIAWLKIILVIVFSIVELFFVFFLIVMIIDYFREGLDKKKFIKVNVNKDKEEEK